MLPPRVHNSPVRALWSNFAGRAGSKFLIELRDNKRIMGLRCPTCGIVYVPPKSICSTCFDQLDEWVQVSNEGTLLTYTVVNYAYSFLYQPRSIPYTVGIIQLDGADTGFCHIVDETSPAKLKLGARVQAVFKKERKASVLDIDYFKIVS